MHELRAGHIDEFPRLRLIAGLVLFNFFARQHRPLGVFIGRIPNDRRKIPHQQHHLMPQLLKIAKLEQRNRPPDVQIRRRRVDPQFNTQPLPRKQPLAQLFLHNHLRHPPRQQLIDILLVSTHRRQMSLLHVENIAQTPAFYTEKEPGCYPRLLVS